MKSTSVENIARRVPPFFTAAGEAATSTLVAKIATVKQAKMPLFTFSPFLPQKFRLQERNAPRYASCGRHFTESHAGEVACSREGDLGALHSCLAGTSVRELYAAYDAGVPKMFM